MYRSVLLNSSKGINAFTGLTALKVSSYKLQWTPGTKDAHIPFLCTPYAS